MCHLFLTSAFLWTLIWWWVHKYLLHFLNCARFVIRCQRQVSIDRGRLCSLLTGLRQKCVGWHSYQATYTYYAYFTWCWTRLYGSFTAWNTLNISHMKPLQASAAARFERMEYKVAVLTNKVRHGRAPNYYWTFDGINDMSTSIPMIC